MNHTLKTTIGWLLRIVAAIIMLQTLYFKFSGAEESVYIFTALGIEPWGRFVTGSFELIASILILYPLSTGMGALLGMCLMLGAIFSHITVLGLVVKDDGGQLFIYACIVLFCCSVLVFQNRENLITLFASIKKKISHV